MEILVQIFGTILDIVAYAAKAAAFLTGLQWVAAATDAHRPKSAARTLVRSLAVLSVLF